MPFWQIVSFPSYRSFQAKHVTQNISVVRPVATVRPNAPIPAGDTPNLVELAASVEPDYRFWRQEFRWLLNEVSINGISRHPEEMQRVMGNKIANQFALKFELQPGYETGLTSSLLVLAHRLAPLLARDADICIDLSTAIAQLRIAADDESGYGELGQSLSAGLASALRPHDSRPGRITFSFKVEHFGMLGLLVLRRSTALAHPLVLLRLSDSLFMKLLDSEAEKAQHLLLWRRLTEIAQRDAGTKLILETTTQPACDLCAVERVGAVMPISCFEVVADSAWLGLNLDVHRLAPGAGGQAISHLRRVLRASLRLADNLVDQLDWSFQCLREDARLNRRLAINLVGIGSLVDLLHLNPAAFSSLHAVSRWVHLLKQLMLRESSVLARTRGPFPGLQVQDLVDSLALSYGTETARSIVKRHSLRHRHLLVLSPAALLPVTCPRYPLSDYLHLLPAMRSADTIAMYGAETAQRLALSDFQRMVQMTWAIARNR